MKYIKFRKNLITPEIAAWFIPVFISSGISIILILLFVIPQYRKSNQVNLELNGLFKKKNELNNLKSQYKIINKKFDKLSDEKTKIIELITGSSSLETLLSKLGEIGKNNDIEFISISPKKITSFNEESKLKNNKKEKGQSKLDVDPLFVEGVKKYIFDISLETKFVDLLSFLRELEFQENIILIEDINLRMSKQQNAKNIDSVNSKDLLQVNIKMKVYGKN
tara:strand:+ start:1329 stop:1994 length:666 start_codon:yes stop_codon:yes gene_type:complete